MQKDTTNKDLIELMQAQFAKIDRRFDTVDKCFNDVDKRFDDVDERFGLVEQRFDSIFGILYDHSSQFDSQTERLERIEKTMATKQYVDYKIADLKGDLLAASQRIVSKHEEKNIFSAEDATFIFSN